MSIAANVALILAAIVTKLSSSIDDVVWLLPFVSPSNKTKKKRVCMAMTYITVMCLVTICAIAISIGGTALVQFILNNNQSFWNAQRILSLASGIILFLYSIYLFYDWYKEQREEEGEKEKDNTESNDVKHVHVPSQSVLIPPDNINTDNTDYDENEVELEVLAEETEETELKKEDNAGNKANKITVSRLIIVAILGSLDDFAVQCALLLGHTFLWYQLLIGVFLGSIIVVIFCVGIGYVKCIVKYIEMVPIWIIIALLAIYTIISAFVNI